MPGARAVVAERLDRVDVTRPGLRVGVDHERVDLEPLRLGVEHRQRAVRAAERQAVDRERVVQPLARADRERRDAVGSRDAPRPAVQPPLA